MVVYKVKCTNTAYNNFNNDVIFTNPLNNVRSTRISVVQGKRTEKIILS